jgi:hypothetical protein
MKYFEELKYEQISEILGTSVGALKASYHHAVKNRSICNHKLNLYLKLSPILVMKAFKLETTKIESDLKLQSITLKIFFRKADA